MASKSELWQKLKYAKESGAPVVLEKQFVQYTEAELQQLVDEVYGTGTPAPAATEAEDASLAASEAFATAVAEAQPEPVAAQSGAPMATPDETDDLKKHPERWGQYAPETLARLLGVPFEDRPSRRAGLTFNTHGPDDPLRVDSRGRVWYMDEVIKPAVPLPRMRRKVKTYSSDVEEVRTKRPDGGFDESFEVAGQEQHEIEVRITLPSFQVGIYRDPRMPFKIHQYNGLRGFDRMDIVRFYGGVDLVPSSIKYIYVGGDLCYDINKVRETMERELREKTLGRSAF